MTESLRSTWELGAESVEGKDLTPLSVPWKFRQRTSGKTGETDAIDTESVETLEPEKGETDAVEIENLDPAVEDGLDLAKDPVDGADLNPPSVPWESWEADATAVEDEAGVTVDSLRAEVIDDGAVDDVAVEAGTNDLPSVPWESWEVEAAAEVEDEDIETPGEAGDLSRDDGEAEDVVPPTVPWSSWQVEPVPAVEIDTEGSSKVVDDAVVAEENTVDTEELVPSSVHCSSWHITRAAAVEDTVDTDTQDETKELAGRAVITTWQPTPTTNPELAWVPDGSSVTGSEESASRLVGHSWVKQTPSIDDALFAADDASWWGSAGSRIRFKRKVPIGRFLRQLSRTGRHEPILGAIL